MSYPLFVPFLILALAGEHAGASTRAQQLAAAFCPFQIKPAKALIDHSLLHDTPLAAIGDEFKERERVYGGCRSVMEKPDGKFEFRYAEALYQLGVDWSAQGKVLSFEAGRPQILNDSFEKIAASAEKLFPGSSLYVEKADVQLYGHNHLKVLNVSHSAQLFLLAALEDQFVAKRARPDQVVRLSARVKATGLGALHYWREGSAVTLDALKNMVIAEGDQTAADLLLETLGSDQVERQAGSLEPYLSHREFALLMNEKMKVPPKRSEHRGFLASLREGTEKVESFDQHAKRVGNVGWFASTQELCAAFRKLRAEPAFLSAAGVRYERELHSISGGDLALKDVTANGVRQVTAVYRKGPGSPWHCFSVTSNHADLISETQFDDLKHRIFRLILKEK